MNKKILLGGLLVLALVVGGYTLLKTSQKDNTVEDVEETESLDLQNEEKDNAVTEENNTATSDTNEKSSETEKGYQEPLEEEIEPQPAPPADEESTPEETTPDEPTTDEDY
ncbi:MAG: hypothetical protein HYW47_01370 [Deltaproteobacteria bacterium]|nr:hypothetical protein [Deltaproteobacteria bacterium]